MDRRHSLLTIRVPRSLLESLTRRAREEDRPVSRVALSMLEQGTNPITVTSTVTGGSADPEAIRRAVSTVTTKFVGM